MVVTEQSKAVSPPHEGKNSAASHIRKHLHLLPSLHLKHPQTMLQAARNRNEDAETYSKYPPFTKQDITQGFKVLQKSSSLQDPPMSPSIRTSNRETCLSEVRREHGEFVSGKEGDDGSGVFSLRNNVVHNKSQLKKRIKGGAIAAKRQRRVRRRASSMIKLSTTKAKKGASGPECTAHYYTLKRAKLLSYGEGNVLEVSTPPHEEALNKHGASELARVLLARQPKTNLATSKDMPNSLSVRYAPKFLHHLMGQHLVTQALLNALSRGRVAPMYVFYGARGTGKRTCAKLFAMALNCLSAGNEKPCRSCRICEAQISGKVSTVKELNASSMCGVKNMRLLMKEVAWPSAFLYKVCLVEECQILSKKAWNALLEGANVAPVKTVFILTTVSIERVPHAIVSRCQKFHFSRLRERDILGKLESIVSQEQMDADREALKLIASSSNGSLHDAEKILDHIVLLGEAVAVPLVQELVGLISDLPLLQLLDFAFSANIIKTIQSLKDLLAAGVEPINLMSQLAGLIMRILGGDCQATQNNHTTRFFRHKEITKSDMERLRQALHILSQAEKQVRGSSDGMTWLLSALLQFPHDRSYIASTCSGDTSSTHSPPRRRRAPNTRDTTPKGGRQSVKIKWQYARLLEPRPDKEIPAHWASSSQLSIPGSSLDHFHLSESPGLSDKSLQDEASTSTGILELEKATECSGKHGSTVRGDDLEQIWQSVLDAVQSTSLKSFLRAQGKLVDLSFRQESREALLEVYHLQHLSRVQRSKESILHAFEAALGHGIKVKVQLVSCPKQQQQPKLTHAKDKVSKIDMSQQDNNKLTTGDMNHSQSLKGANAGYREDDIRHGARQKESEPMLVYETVPSLIIKSQKIRENDRVRIVSVKSKEVGRLPSQTALRNRKYTVGGGYATAQGTGVGLGYLAQQAEGSIDGYSQDLQFDEMNKTSRQAQAGHSMQCVHVTTKDRNVPLATKLEEENLEMESASKEHLCWRTSGNTLSAVEGFQPWQRHSKLLSFLSCATCKPY